jgi:ubiquinone/menaquinone biosynthesis C-methylase UbiE
VREGSDNFCVNARETYSHGHHDSVLRSHRWRTAENSAGYLLPHLRADDRLLDVGVGPGTITLDLASRLPAGQVVGVDNARAAVESTRALVEQVGVGNVQVEVADVYALDLADGEFDVVHAHQVLQHLADPLAALTEMRRVCRPGGLVAVRDADYAAMTWYPESSELTRWLELYRALARANGGEPDAGRRLRSWAEQVGFARVTSSASVWCFASPDDLAWWTGTWAERLTASAFGDQAVAHRLADADELARLAAGWRAWGRRPGAWFSVLHGEVLAEVATP